MPKNHKNEYDVLSQEPDKDAEDIPLIDKPTNKFSKLCKYAMVTCFLVVIAGLLYKKEFFKFSKEVDYEPVERAIWDKREMKHIKLDNELNLIMISRPDYQMSGVALAVRSGSFQDIYPGTAHLLEHSLFLASEKYGENAFLNCLSKNQGSFNAMTSYDWSAYFFSSSDIGFGNCFDIFANFFISPLLDQEMVYAELSAVDSEYRKDLSINEWKDEFAEKLSMDENSRQNLFSVGSYETLDEWIQGNGTTLSEELKFFFNSYYSANLMTVVIQTPQPMEELEQLSVETFSQIHNSNTEDPTFDTPVPFPKDKQQQLMFYERSTAVFFINFVLSKEYIHEVFAQPIQLICSVLNYGNKNSLSDYLNEKGYIIGQNFQCESGGQIGQSILTIEGVPTELGLENYQDMFKIIFAYIKKMKEEFDFKEYYNDRNQINKINYKFSEPTTDLNTEDLMAALNFNNELKYFEPDASEFIFSIDHVLYEFDQHLIDEILSDLTVENTNIYLGGPDFTPEAQTNFYGQLFEINERYQITYQIVPYQDQFISEMQNADKDDCYSCILPKKNNYIPTNFDILTHCPESNATCQTEERQADHEKEPVLVEQNPLYKVFVKTERFYNLPVIQAGLQFYLSNV